MVGRTPTGRFKRTVLSDVGLGVCSRCNGITRAHYYGDPRDEFIDPRNFKQRCFTCNPLTQTELELEKEIESSKPKQKTMEDILKGVADEFDRRSAG